MHYSGVDEVVMTVHLLQVVKPLGLLAVASVVNSTPSFTGQQGNFASNECFSFFLCVCLLAAVKRAREATPIRYNGADGYSATLFETPGSWL